MVTLKMHGNEKTYPPRIENETTCDGNSYMGIFKAALLLLYMTCIVDTWPPGDEQSVYFVFESEAWFPAPFASMLRSLSRNALMF